MSRTSAAKGVVAGGANLVIGLALAGWGASSGIGEIAAALVVGAAGYGWSIMLWVKGARDLGAARGQVIFATAPFIGAAIAWIVLDEPVLGVQVIALAAVGIAVSLRSDHVHDHRHHEAVHEHDHTHDDGPHDHDHRLEDESVDVWHVHQYRHSERVRAHPHVPDLHHRHDH